MVRKYSLLHRSAFTMIELIFAIVIIAISIVSLPMMIQTTTKGIENNIIQEAIFAAAAILNESTTYYWDKHSLNDINSSGGYSRVVNTGNCSNTVPSKRSGHINRQCLDDNSTTPFNGLDNGAIEWVANVYNNQPVLEGVGPGAATYKDAYNATATVTNCGTGGCIYFGLPTDTNPTKKSIKQIQISITKAGVANPIIVLRAYATNIGEVKPQRKVF